MFNFEYPICEVMDYDGIIIGRITYAGGGMAVYCRQHARSKMCALRRRPSEVGAMRWLQSHETLGMPQRKRMRRHSWAWCSRDAR